MSQLLPERRTEGRTERWEPLRELEEVTDRMRRMVEQTFGRFDVQSALPERAGWSPLVDIEETDDAYVIEAELPGVNREDVDVELVRNELVISGEIKERERKGAMRHRARRTGRFDYRVGLRDPVDPEKIEARLEHGVLTVRAPKSERAERRRIEIGS